MALFTGRAYTFTETVAHTQHKDLHYCAFNTTESCPFSEIHFHISTVRYYVFRFHIFGIKVIVGIKIYVNHTEK
jgi:hypothetical protein